MSKLAILLIVGLYAAGVNADNILRLNTTTKAPLHTKDHSGFLDKISLEMLSSIGYQLETVSLPAERALINVNAGLEDGEMSRVKAIEKHFPNLMRVPEKLLDMQFVVYSKKPIDLSDGWKSLENKAVAFINGWKILEFNVPKSAEITKVKDSQQLFTLLKNERTDYIIYTNWTGEYILNEMKMHDVSLRSPPLATKELYMYLHKKHKKLVSPLARELLRMKQDGRYAQLFQKILMSTSADKP